MTTDPAHKSKAEIWIDEYCNKYDLAHERHCPTCGNVPKKILTDCIQWLAGELEKKRTWASNCKNIFVIPASAVEEVLK